MNDQPAGGTGIAHVRRSEPELEPEGLCFATAHSAALGRRGDVTVFVPPGCDRPLPVLLLLHGIHGSHWHWAFRGGAHRTLMDMMSEGLVAPMALVMPSDGLWAEGSGYCAHDGVDHERWILDDAMAIASACHPHAIVPGSPLGIAGLSMGGYGAMRIGARHPQRFRAISAHSAITDLEQFRLFIDGPCPIIDAVPTAERLIVRHLDLHRELLPPLRFDCGRDDPLIGHNRELHRDLAHLGIAHRYDEFPGDHGWPYWRRHLRESVLFFHEALRATESPRGPAARCAIPAPHGSPTTTGSFA